MMKNKKISFITMSMFCMAILFTQHIKSMNKPGRKILKSTVTMRNGKKIQWSKMGKIYNIFMNMNQETLGRGWLNTYFNHYKKNMPLDETIMARGGESLLIILDEYAGDKNLHNYDEEDIKNVFLASAIGDEEFEGLQYPRDLKNTHTVITIDENGKVTRRSY